MFFLNVMVTSGKISPTFRRKKGQFDNQVFIETKIIVLCGKRSRELLVKCDLKLFYFARSNMDLCFIFLYFSANNDMQLFIKADYSSSKT